MRAGAENFGFDDRNDPVVVPERGIAAERVCFGGEGEVANGRDVDHRMPFGERRALCGVFGQSPAELVQIFGVAGTTTLG